MNRRTFIAALGGAAAWPLTLRAQPDRPPGADAEAVQCVAKGHFRTHAMPSCANACGQCCDVKILLANPEPSTHGPSRHFAAMQRFGRTWSEADINW